MHIIKDVYKKLQINWRPRLASILCSPTISKWVD